MIFQVVGHPFFGVGAKIEIVEGKIIGVEDAAAKGGTSRGILVDIDGAADQDIFGVIDLGIGKVHHLDRAAVSIFNHRSVRI